MIRLIWRTDFTDYSLSFCEEIEKFMQSEYITKFKEFASKFEEMIGNKQFDEKEYKFDVILLILSSSYSLIIPLSFSQYSFYISLIRNAHTRQSE
jgi:hypothetical protein